MGGVQQRFGRNAAAIEAHAAGIDFGIDQRGGETEIRGQKRGGVAAGPAANDDNLNVNH